MAKQRTLRLNSLLREVISEVIRDDVRNPDLPQFITVTRVDITSDLKHAKVYISVIGDQAKKDLAIELLQSMAGFIAVTTSKKVVMRFFPNLQFVLDDTVEKQMRIESLLSDISAEKQRRNVPDSEQSTTSSEDPAS